LEQLWPDEEHPQSILGSVAPILKGTGDIAPPHLEGVAANVALIVGDLALSSFEDGLSESWPKCLGGDPRAFRVISAFWRIIKSAADRSGADVVLVDVGPNLGAINRAALIAADYVVIPLGPDLFSLQGLRNLGPTLDRWRIEWGKRLNENPEPSLELPSGRMQPVGYVMMRHSVRLDRPVKAYGRWIARMPLEYRRSVLRESVQSAPRILDDPHCLAQMKDYRSLMPMAQESNKPLFFLKPADGAIGGHQTAVQDGYRDFHDLARKIAARCDIPLS